MSKHRYNWSPSLPDQRDFKFSKSTMAIKKSCFCCFGKKILSSVDLRSKCPPIEDQGQIGSCTANAWAGLYEYLELNFGEGKLSPTSIDASRLFIYYNERLLEGDVNQDAGASLRDGAKALANFGVCVEDAWAYDPNLLFTKPTDPVYAAASSHKISTYHSLASLDDAKQCLSQGYPFVFGISVYDSFESQAVANTGVIPLPSQNESLLGGHALCAVGYDDSKKWFIVRNSWGDGWGDKGYCYIPYAYLGNSDLASDFWMASK